MRKKDVVIIGAGHNSLVAAAYLAKAGKKVTVLERREVLGGCASTREVWPGYKISETSYVISLFQPKIIEDLKLKENGLVILPRNPSSITPDLNGPGIVLSRDQKRNHKEISRYSEKDAENFSLYEQSLERIVSVIEPIIAQAPPQIFPFGSQRSFIGKIKEFYRAGKLGKELLKLGDRLPETVELLTGAATPILNRWFESEILKTTLATDAIIGAFSSPAQEGSAYVLMHHIMGESGGARGDWGYVQGGMGGLASSIEKVCVQLGVNIIKNSPVDEICVEGYKRKVSGVVSSGKEFKADVVVSGVDPNLTFNRLVGITHLPADFVDSVNKIDYSSASAKINLVLGRVPHFLSSVRPIRTGDLRGTIHISPTMDYIEKAFEDAKRGNSSENPVLEMTIPSMVDNTLVPKGSGHHIMNIFVQYAPYNLDPKYGGWDKHKDVFIDRCLNAIENYAPGFRNSIIHKQMITPLDLERTFGLTGGNIFQGSMKLSQMYFMRPVAGWSDYRTPINGLYMCGSATHPGGGVMGTCGRNAAEAILKDTGRDDY